MTVGDYLVNSLTAQSLDLPPAVSLLLHAALLAARPHRCACLQRLPRPHAGRVPSCVLAQAAQWRQDHRSDAFKQRKLIVWEVDETEPWEGACG